jgi:hypothetical protein
MSTQPPIEVLLTLPTGCRCRRGRRKVINMSEPASKLLVLIVEVLIIIYYTLLSIKLDRIEKKIDEIRKR